MPLERGGAERSHGTSGVELTRVKWGGAACTGEVARVGAVQLRAVLSDPTCALARPTGLLTPSFQRKLESSPAVAVASSAAGPQRSLG